MVMIPFDTISKPKLDEVDEALYFGLCMDKQNEQIESDEVVNE